MLRAAADKMGAAALEAGSLGAIVDGIPSGLINGPVVSAILDRAGELLPALGLSGWQLWLAQMALRLIRSGIQAAPAK
jgi:ABC-type antimicrobial peptide transport system permease subunit